MRLNDRSTLQKTEDHNITVDAECHSASFNYSQLSCGKTTTVNITADFPTLEIGTYEVVPLPHLPIKVSRDAKNKEKDEEES